MGRKNAAVKIDGKEVSSHTSKESCWIAVRGKVYDVTGMHGLAIHALSRGTRGTSADGV
jgi:hypothetical protein